MDLILLHDDDDGGGGKEKEKLYVAVGKEVRESESTLLWAIQNSGGRSISIIHVHQPDPFIPILGKKHHWSSLEEQQVRAYRGIERKLMLKTLDEYLHICRQFGLQAEKLYIEMDSVENGILQLITQHNIEKLVMGAAADDTYNMKMVEPKSKKAVHLQLHAPFACDIWFICKGHLIHHREGSSQMRMCAENGRSTNSRSPSNSDVNSQEFFLRKGSSHFEASNGRVAELPSMDYDEVAHSSQTQLDLEANSRDWSEIMRLSESQGLNVAIGSSSHVSKELTADSFSGPYAEQCHQHLYHPPPIASLGEAANDEVERLKQAMLKAKHSTRVAIEELINCQCAEVEAVYKEKTSERLYVEEAKKRKDLEEELERVKNERDRLREELKVAMHQNSVLESKVANYAHVVKVLEDGMVSNVELLQICEKERDDLKIERDNVLKTAEELLNQSAEATYKTDVPRFFTTVTFSEIKEATNDFDPSLQLWEGENGSIYKGFLSHSCVTIKMWHPEGLQGPREFHQEVEVLSKFRHPNLVSLMGVCPEAWALIYEHLPNGTLEERLSCKGNTPPLSWKTRIRIASELCSALIFLHSRTPQKVVHCALKPSSILLDSNFMCKISDFGFSHILPDHETSLSTTLSSSSVYTDPDFFVTGVVTPAVDVYSFGMIVLELLTGKPVFGATAELQEALDENDLDSFLDASAGDWPFVQAEQLAQLALRCCEENSSNRPDLESDIWRVLEPMRASCSGSPSYHLNEVHRQAPSYFICPIFQEVMKDPHVAADGYTYEAEALRGWLDTGHDTSPMTNLRLDHLNLVPNHALRSAIQEWREQH